MSATDVGYIMPRATEGSHGALGVDMLTAIRPLMASEVDSERTRPEKERRYLLLVLQKRSCMPMHVSGSPSLLVKPAVAVVLGERTRSPAGAWTAAMRSDGRRWMRNITRTTLTAYQAGATLGRQGAGGRVPI